MVTHFAVHLPSRVVDPSSWSRRAGRLCVALSRGRCGVAQGRSSPVLTPVSLSEVKKQNLAGVNVDGKNGFLELFSTLFVS